MKRFPSVLALASVASMVFGCKQGMEVANPLQIATQSTCQPVTERIYVNERFPADIEHYSPDSMRVFMFEDSFTDSVSITVDSKMTVKGYLATKSNGFAGRLLIKAQPNEEVIINTTNGCAHFTLKDGYKYLYINRSANKKWDVSYSNFSRGYL